MSGDDLGERNRGLHRFAVLVATSTLVLIFIGGLVTSTLLTLVLLPSLYAWV